MSVNTFFHSLPRGLHAAGRDVYGNRDLAAYEDGRRDVEKIVRRFVGSSISKLNQKDDVEAQVGAEEPREAMPKEIAKAYLERLGREILEKAEAL